MNNWRFRQATYTIKSYIPDIITTFLALILAFIFFRSADNATFGFTISLFIVFVAIFFIIWFRLKEQTFYYIPLRTKNEEDKWVGIGTFRYRKTQEAFLITESDSGFIHSKCLTWVDYKLTFNFKIIHRYLGVVLKAVDLSNYVMLQIRENGIYPHIRINGGWRVWDTEEAGLKFRTNLSLDKWYKCTISTESEAIVIKIYDADTSILNREWHIPRGSVAFLSKRDENDPGLPITFPINLDYGSFGFRNYGDERALVRDLLAEKL